MPHCKKDAEDVDVKDGVKIIGGVLPELRADRAENPRDEDRTAQVPGEILLPGRARRRDVLVARHVGGVDDGAPPKAPHLLGHGLDRVGAAPGEEEVAATLCDRNGDRPPHPLRRPRHQIGALTGQPPAARPPDMANGLAGRMANKNWMQFLKSSVAILRVGHAGSFGRSVCRGLEARQHFLVGKGHVGDQGGGWLTTVAGRPAILPSVSGWARVTGLNTIFVDPRDPLMHGFQII